LVEHLVDVERVSGSSPLPSIINGIMCLYHFMINQDLKNYITGSLAHGKSRLEMRSELLSVGWSNHEVDQALSEILPDENSGQSAPSIFAMIRIGWQEYKENWKKIFFIMFLPAFLTVLLQIASFRTAVIYEISSLQKFFLTILGFASSLTLICSLGEWEQLICIKLHLDILFQRWLFHF
jgi:hypothetical protein